MALVQAAERPAALSMGFQMVVVGTKSGHRVRLVFLIIVSSGPMVNQTAAFQKPDRGVIAVSSACGSTV